MKLNELNHDQLSELKQRYLMDHESDRDGCTSFEELANADELVTMEQLTAEYGCTEFVPDDFCCTTDPESPTYQPTGTTTDYTQAESILRDLFIEFDDDYYLVRSALRSLNTNGELSDDEYNHLINEYVCPDPDEPTNPTPDQPKAEPTDEELALWYNKLDLEQLEWIYTDHFKEANDFIDWCDDVWSKTPREERLRIYYSLTDDKAA